MGWKKKFNVDQANPFLLKRIFLKYASVELDDGTRYMTREDFIQKFIGLLTTPDYNRKSLRLLGGIIDTSKDELISFDEFQAFEKLLCVPDALYSTAFRLFDTSGNGLVSFGEFAEIIQHTILQKTIPFDLNGDFVKLYFGRDKKRVVTYAEFSQFLHDFHEAYTLEAFRYYDRNYNGYISVDDFCTIMTTIRAHLITEKVAAQLKSVITTDPDSKGQVSFPFYMAFNYLVTHMELMKKVYLQATKGKQDVPISQREFLLNAQMMSHITPLDVHILFKLSHLIYQSDYENSQSNEEGDNNNGTHKDSGPMTIMYSDLQNLSPEQYYKKVNQRVLDIKAVNSAAERGILILALEMGYRFAMGSVAGAVEAISVYPADIVKTRLQNQKPSTFLSDKMYKNNFDCLKRIIAVEGWTALYRGIFTQILCISWGKAFKLSMNDYVRDRFRNRRGEVSIPGEILAGACAGVSSVLVTNPLEVVKIRIQLAGELFPKKKLRAFSVLKQLGFLGLYKGVVACLMRDVPFSAIFFPLYAHTKVKFQDNNGYNSPASLLFAGAICTIPAAPISMPFDVVHTRLQAVPRPGEIPYKGMLDVFDRIIKEEGVRTFWRGTRMIKPTQFGITILMYELLQRTFYIDFAGTRPSGSEASILISSVDQVKSTNPDHVGGYALSWPILHGIETKFGLVFPRFESSV